MIRPNLTMQYDRPERYIEAQPKLMSMHDIDGAETQQAKYPTPRQVDMQIPSSPGVTGSSKADPDLNSHEVPGSPERTKPSTGPAPQWTANYTTPVKSPNGRRLSSAAEALAGARSPEELLRRLSLTVQLPKDPAVAGFNPRTAYPGLGLSGNVISATFCVPYKIDYRSNGEWVCTRRVILGRILQLTKT